MPILSMRSSVENLGANCYDFVARDLYETGIGSFSERYNTPDNHFVFVLKDAQITLAINLRKGEIRPLTNIFELLWNRYKLSESVYFHKTMIQAEAMVAKCLRRMVVLEREFGRKGVLNTFISENTSDDRFYTTLVDYKDEVIPYIGGRLQDRDLYELVFRFTRKAQSDFKNYLIENYRRKNNYDKCQLLEKLIATKFGLDEKEIIIYCNNPEMYSVDINDFPVLLSNQYGNQLRISSIGQLDKSLYDTRKIQMIKEDHSKLWNFYVYCGIKDENKLRDISAFCEETFRSVSSLERFLQSGPKHTNTSHSKRKTQATDSENIFISHSSNDEKLAELLEAELSKTGLSLFRYKNRENYGTDFIEDIEHLMRQCESMIAIWSTSASKSRWVKGEITSFIEKGKRIIIVELDKTSIPGLFSAIERRKHNGNVEILIRDLSRFFEN